MFERKKHVSETVKARGAPNLESCSLEVLHIVHIHMHTYTHSYAYIKRILSRIFRSLGNSGSGPQVWLAKPMAINIYLKNYCISVKQGVDFSQLLVLT